MKQITTDDGKTIIPLSDIYKFTVFHERYQYGLKLKAYIKPELCTVIEDDGTVIKEGKYKNFKVYENDKTCRGDRLGTTIKISKEIANSFYVLGKFNKNRSKFMNIAKKKGKTKKNHNVVMTGLSSGYGVTTSYIEYIIEEE